MESSEKDLVELMSCGTSEEANVVKSVLDSEGIFALVQGQGLRQSLGNIYGSYIDLRVLVRTEDLNRARELLTRSTDELEKAAEEAALESGLPPEEAPLPSDVEVAGEDYSSRRRKLAWTLIALFWVVPLAIVFLSRGCAR